MPFITLNKNWSDLANFYNASFNGNFLGSFTPRQPLITGQNSIPNVVVSTKPTIPKTLYNSFDDGLIRGGVINVGISAGRDFVRVGNFLKSGKGLLWVAKQVGLQRSNPKLEELPGTPILSRFNTRLYNLGLNTLTQVPLNALGGHIIRHGILPVGGVGFLEGDSRNNVKGYNYENVALTNDKNGNNRLIKYLSYYQGNPNPKGPNGPTYSPDDTTPMFLQDYQGGANSVYGIGTTQIFSTTVRTDFKTINSGFISDTRFTPLTYKSINNWFNRYRESASLEGQIDKDYDFSVYQGVTGSLGSEIIDDYSVKNIQSYYGVSTSKYGPNNIKTNYKVDAINAIDVTDSSTFYSNVNQNKKNSDVLVDYKDQVDGYYGKDIIKFRLEFLNNDTSNLADGSVNTDVLAFRAYIDDFNDGMIAKWNSYRYMGRGEEFYVYEGFTRDISVAFTIYSHTPEEADPLFKKLNYLMSSFTPDYNSANRMRGNIGYLTVGDYIYRQPGVFTDIKLTGMLDTHWEIGSDVFTDSDGNKYSYAELPKHIKVNLSFKPIHDFLPRRVNSTNKAPFISAVGY